MSTEPSFEAAIAEARRQQERLTDLHFREAQPVLMEHGRRTSVAVTWLHGYTNCPQQFQLLGRMCWERGWNVWIPLAPHHGLADRMSTAGSRLRAEELVEYGNAAVEVCRGLGEHVVIGGLSMGGALAAYLSMHRPDIEVALSIAPFLSPFGGPLVFTRMAAGAARLLPNVMVWWNPKAKESLPGPTHTYLRYSTRGLAEILKLGFAFVADAKRRAPSASHLRFVLNDNDNALRNTLAEAVLARWKGRGVTNADAVVLDKALGLQHDLIDPDQPHARTDIVYPILLDAIEGALPAAAGARD